MTTMLIFTVEIKVRMEMIGQFKQATIDNAQNSMNESGILTFDFGQHREDPSNFYLYEVYKNDEAVLKHQETSHYKLWRDKVESMMAQPRKINKYTNICPDDENW